MHTEAGFRAKTAFAQEEMSNPVTPLRMFPSCAVGRHTIHTREKTHENPFA